MINRPPESPKDSIDSPTEQGAHTSGDSSTSRTLLQGKDDDPTVGPGSTDPLETLVD